MTPQTLIIGGGPAGAATALQLLSQGIGCIILEAAESPVWKPGETIPPQAYPLFKKTGLTDLLHHPHHLTCYGNRFIWGQQQPTDKLFFYNTVSQGWHLNRQTFETQLAEKVIQAGGRYLWGCHMISAVQKDGWQIIYTNAEGLQQSVTCSFVADATGRKSRFARKLGIQRKTIDKLAGITTTVSSARKIQQYTYLEAEENGWWYAAPLSDDKLILSYMTDTDLIPPSLRKTSGLVEKVRTTTLISDLLQDSKYNNHLKISSAATGYLSQRFGDNWLAVGDAAYAYDPISSYGITSALEGGYYAGHAIAEHLQGNTDALPAYDWAISNAFGIYLQMLEGQYKLEKRWSQSPFWNRRS